MNFIDPNDDCFKNDKKEFQKARKILIELENDDEFYAIYKKIVKDRIDLINSNFQIRKEGKEEGDKKRKYKVCETMLDNNEDIELIELYTEFTIEEITQYQESLRKRRRLN